MAAFAQSAQICHPGADARLLDCPMVAQNPLLSRLPRFHRGAFGLFLVTVLLTMLVADQPLGDALVLHPGAVSTGSDISVIERDAAGLTVADAHRAMGDRRLEDRTLVEALAAHDRLADEWRLPLVERLARR